MAIADIRRFKIVPSVMAVDGKLFGVVVEGGRIARFAELLPDEGVDLLTLDYGVCIPDLRRDWALVNDHLGHNFWIPLSWVYVAPTS
jgi:hypothetical protein